MSVQVHSPAPDFELPAIKAGEDFKLKLSDYRGKWVVLFTYPADFSGICSSEIPEFNRRLGEFESLGAAVVAFSTDSTHSHRKWLADFGTVHFPVGADKTNRVAAEWGVLQANGTCLRGTFIIDPEGTVKWIMHNHPLIARNVDEVFRTLRALQSGGACLVNWQPKS